jgi:hypothetical protein
MDRRTRQRQDEPERRPPDDRQLRRSPTDAVLELQRGAGNRAVSSLLARAPDTKEKPKEATATGTRATLPDIGTIPLVSVQFAGSPHPGRGRGEEDEKQTGGEIVVSSRAGKHSQQLMKASLEGKPMTVEVVIAGSEGAIRLELKGAIISSYSTGSGGGEEIETWPLNFQSMEHSVKSEAQE